MAGERQRGGKTGHGGEEGGLAKEEVGTEALDAVGS